MDGLSWWSVGDVLRRVVVLDGPDGVGMAGLCLFYDAAAAAAATAVT